MPDKITAALNEIRARDVQLWDRRGSVGFATQVIINEGKDDVPRLLAALDAVLALHTEFRIYDECDHNHTTEDVEQGIAVECGDFVSCHQEYLYPVCAACCNELEYGQTEQCAGEHRHSPGTPVCATMAAISRALLGEDGTGG